MFTVRSAGRRGSVVALTAASVAMWLAVACGDGSTAPPSSAAEQSQEAGAVDQSEGVAAGADSGRSEALEAAASAPREEAPAPREEEGAPPPGADEEAAAATPVWQTRSPLAARARQETAVVALHGEIYVLGGFDASGRIVPTVEAYDPGDDQWRSVADLPEPLHHANAAVVGGKIYVAGFLTGPFVADGRMFIYDPETDAWAAGPPMPTGTERGAAGVAVLAGKIYVAGGLRFGAVGDFSVYEPVAEAWELLPDLPAPRDHLVAGGIDGVIYVAGGRGGTISAVSGRLDAFDPLTGGWSQRASLPTPRGGVAGAILEGRLYVIGGEGNSAAASGVFAEVEAYDPETDRWTSLPPLPTPRHGTGAAALRGQVYVPGGATQQGFGAVATHERLLP